MKLKTRNKIHFDRFRGTSYRTSLWKATYNRFNRWAAKGLWSNFFKLRGEIDTEWIFTDGSHIRAHQHASRARSGEERAIGRSCGGLTSKIHVCADAHGNPIDIEITGGEVHDSQVAPGLIERSEEGDCWIADKGYDFKEIRECVRKKGMKPIIPRRSNCH